MTINFRPAVQSEAKPLVGLYSESGCGKTKSALLLAKGFTGDMRKVGMIETESGRGEAYAGDAEVGGYAVLSLRENFSPKMYGEAITAAEKAGLQCLIVDSASHEWEGAGGVLSMAADNEQAGKKGVLVWQQPKISHAREFMLRLMQTPIPCVIICMRAKYPMYQVSPADVKRWEDAGRPGGKPPKVGDWARSGDLAPKQSEDILYEMFVHGWIDREHRFRGTKYTVDPLRKIFVDGEPITAATGRKLAEWCGAIKASTSAPAADGSALDGASPEYITDEQIAYIETTCADNTLSLDALKAAAKVTQLSMILAADYPRAKQWIDTAIQRRQQRAA